ncbi:MAG TPA: DUF1345 domain-containing protein [Micromonosporaceae bacterium]|jgi:uncharacterized membrane protein
MTEMPPATAYHRLIGWHAPALRRAAVVCALGVAVGLLLMPSVPWQLATVGGWDAAAFGFLVTVWPIIARATASHVEQLAGREDVTGGAAAVLLLAASAASLLGVAFALGLAGRTAGSERSVLILVAVLTVVLSWTVVNTVYTLRYAHRYFDAVAGDIDFPEPTDATRHPTYRDFAYVAFTIGMTYQVSDTAIRGVRLRRIVLAHAILSYVFGVVIVGGVVNIIAGLAR